MTSTRIRAACFDFDGTLAYMSPSHWALYAEAARDAGIDVSEAALAADTADRAWEPWMTPLGVAHLDASASQEAFRALRAGLAADRIRTAAPGAPEAALAEAGRHAAILEEQPARYVLFDDALPALRRLAEAGITSIIVSNHIWTLPEIVDALGMGALVGGVITSARGGYRKPHPAIFAEAMRLLGGRLDALRADPLRPDEVVMVGDSLSADVRGGAAAGMRAVLLDRAGTSTAPDRPDGRDVPDGADGAHVARTLLDVPLGWPGGDA